MPWYRKHGKILKIITDKEFNEKMQTGDFKSPDHKPYPVLLYYSAVRKTEAHRSIKEQYEINEQQNALMFDVGPRLKKLRLKRKGKPLAESTIKELYKKKKASMTTPPIPLPLDAPHMNTLLNAIDKAEPGQPIFKFSSKTAYNIIDRVFAYPHLFRLSRITWFFMPHPEAQRPRGFSIPEVRNWTGLSLAALDYYIGLADVADMGRAMYQQQRQQIT
jgi:hypothetical protein